ncbi:MAG: chromosome segregation protein SMC [Candidatus Binatia bacterium]
MRIRRLELCGFKSFVDPTSLEFSKGVSGIVGPNGCGKSNLVDALRWVLGEQSAKRLRGDAMEDLIFNGTETGRGPAGMAEVSLILDNEEPLLESDDPSDIVRQMRDVAEIQVTRRYFRSGESEYLINNRPCRLKDVTELFLGTGVGTKAYAMIEQGRVDQLVNARPEDVRLFIEEAAGTTLYRDRRLAAERKMERTRDNLTRVGDILQEIDRNIVLYRRLAKRAEQYRLLQQELRAAELQVARRKLDRLDTELAEIDARGASLRKLEAEFAAAIDSGERERESARERLARAEAELRARQEALFEARSARSGAQARLEMLDREEIQAADQLARLQRDREHTAERVAELAAEIDQRGRVLAQLVADNREGEDSLARGEATHAEAERRVAGLALEVDQAKTENVERQRGESEMRNRLHAAEERAADRRRRREALRVDLGGLEAEDTGLGAELEKLGVKREAVERRIADAREELARLVPAIATRRVQKVQLEEASIAAAAALAEAQSRLVAAEEVERGYGRYDEGVRAVMQRHATRRNGVLGLVAEVIDAPPELEKAVAAVLAERLQYVVVRTPEDARDAVQELKQAGSGRSNFIPVRPRQPQLGDPPVGSPSDGCTRLLEAVRVEEGYGDLAESLLGDAVLVDDLDRGIELWRRNGHWRTLVTREGEVVHPDGAIGGGSAPPAEERLLAQRREIRRLRQDVARLAAEAADLDTKRNAQAVELSTAEKHLTAIEEATRTLTIERVTVEKDAERVKQDGDRTVASLTRARAEDEQLERELAGLVEEVAATERAVAEAAAAREVGDERRRGLEADLGARRTALEAETAAVLELKIRLVRAREKEDALRQGLEQMKRSRGELSDWLERLHAEAEGVEALATNRTTELASLHTTLQRAAQQETERQESFESSRAGEEGLRREIESAERRLGEVRAELDRSRQERSSCDVLLAERRAHREYAVATMRDRYQVELAEVMLEPGEEADLEARCQTLRQKVERMDRGAVGVEAMEELGSMEERRGFLANEKADLERSLGDLQKTIANLNRMSRDRFSETFSAVNEKFQETFPKLFRGGRAYLALTDESDLMNTGVDMHVQPPGMNLRHLSLLSGGQKALTAVSLIFALFMCRPSPFCVLDEVDAPLDDANIDRFNHIVGEMGRESQFLIITHNQRTMEVADCLYGVTMDEPGVSRIVSVRLQSAA